MCLYATKKDGPEDSGMVGGGGGREENSSSYGEKQVGTREVGCSTTYPGPSPNIGAKNENNGFTK